MPRSNALAIALAAVMIAVTAVFTLLVRVPIPATQGYFNFSDVAIYFAAFSFGPASGFIAGGVGTAIADLIGGYPQWAVLSLLAHGLQGFIAGWLARWLLSNDAPLKEFMTGLERYMEFTIGLERYMEIASLIVAWLAGSVVMVGLYYIGAGLLITGWGPALAEIPANILQNVGGGLVGIPLFYAVRKAYPPIVQLGRGGEWREG